MGHSPVIAPSGGFFDGGKVRAEHNGISAGGKGFTDITALAETAVGNYRNVFSRVTVIFISGRRAVDSGGYLGDTETEYFAGSTGGAGTDAYQHSGNARPHQFQAGVIANAVADDNRHLNLFNHLGENQAAVALGDMAGAGGGGVHYQDIAARPPHQWGPAHRFGGG